MWRRNARAWAQSCHQRMFSSSRFQVEPSVQEAISNGEPVVALESTIVAHGMPYPQNLEVAQVVQSILREKGVTPATIAVRDGICRVGLTCEELADLAKAGEEGRATKCSTRELSLFMAKSFRNVDKEGHRWGATTVASTMVLAHRAGISTFVTGGIGGVHRNGHVTMDISADLNEMSRSPVVVVSAGIKSILDIRRTLEALETMGVPTVSYGTDEFPAFFSPHSGVASPARMDDAAIIARAYWAARELGLSHGMLVAVPNDDPAGDNVERAIQQALTDAEDQNINGQALTPFLLKEVARQTGGDSLRSNMALVRKNARIGADIALAIALQKSKHSAEVSSSINPKAAKVVVLGGAVVDILARPAQGHDLITATSNPGICTESDGGVGRNIAEALGRLGSRPLMYSAVGNDSRGRALKSQLEHDCGVIDRVGVVEHANTATYLALLDGSGDLHTAVADMAVLSQIRPPPVATIRAAKLLVMDANPPLQVLQEAAIAAAEHGVKVVLDPTSVPKARGIAHDKKLLSCISYAFPNVDELVAMADVLSDDGDIQSSSLLVEKLNTVRTLAMVVLSKMHPSEAHLIVTMGQEGLFLASNTEANKFSCSHFPPQEGVQVLNATGAGDSLCGAFCHGILEGKTVTESVAFGIEAAVMSLQCQDRAISPYLSNLIKKD